MIATSICTTGQIKGEVKRITDMILEVYRTFGLTATLKFATRPEPADR